MREGTRAYKEKIEKEQAKQHKNTRDKGKENQTQGTKHEAAVQAKRGYEAHGYMQQGKRRKSTRYKVYEIEVRVNSTRNRKRGLLGFLDLNFANLNNKGQY